MSDPRPSILLVEDDAAIRFTMEAMIRPLQTDVTAVNDGQEALDAVARSVPDLILLDLMLPHVNGYQFLRAFREDHPDVPVIVVSAKSDSMDLYWAKKLGVREYIQKPFSSQQLRKAIEAALREETVSGS